MNQTEKWYESRGVWGALVAGAAGVAGLFGYAVSAEEQENIAALVIGLVTTISGVLAFIGRLKASKRIE